jgi:hypothetical protein
MNIYIVMEEYYNGCDSYVSVYEVYRDEYAAEVRCSNLNENGSISTSWFVRTEEVLEGINNG